MGNNKSIPNYYRDYQAAFSYSDLLLELESLSDLREGWRLLRNPKQSSSHLDKLMTLQTIKIGFLGPEAALKSHLINQISGYTKNKPNSQIVYDLFKGLRIRYSKLKVLNAIKNENLLNPDHKTLTCFSSNREDTPVYFHKDEMLFKFMSKCHELGHLLSDGRTVDHLDSQKYENLKNLMLNDKVFSESFLDSFICEISNFIVIVVGHITFDDQIYIRRIVNENKSLKKIFVIHFFDDCKTLVQANFRIDKEIKGIFHVKDVPIDIKNLLKINDKHLGMYNRTIYVDDSLNEPTSFLNYVERNCTIHLIYASEGTSIAKYFNKMTFSFMNDLIKKKIGESQKFNLIESLKNFIEDNYLKYFSLYRRNEKEPLKINVLEEEKYGNKFIKTNINHEIKYLSDSKYDQIGNIISTSNEEYQPCYHVSERKNFFDILIEVPFLKKETLKIIFDRADVSYQYMLVSGEKKNNLAEVNTADPNVFDLKGNLEWGIFNLKIPITNFSIRLKKKKDMQYKDGMIHIRIFKGEDENEQILSDNPFKEREDDIRFSEIVLEKAKK